MKESEHIAFIELGGSHDECLLTQLHAIKSRGHRIELICTPDLLDRNPNFLELLDSHRTITKEELNNNRKRTVAALWQHLKSNQFDKVIFNTAQGSIVRDLALKALFNKIEFIGVLHTTRKLKGSFTQKLINLKFKKYFFLARFLYDSVANGSSKLSWFYPIRFPYDNKEHHSSEKTKITIIGGVEYRRKDLDGFLELIKGLDPTKYEFVFLGQTDKRKEGVEAFLKQLENEEISIKIYQNFVSQKSFHEELITTNFILPLIHPDTPSADQYFKNQIPGSMSVALAYGIPMLIHEGYKHIDELKDATFYYNEDKFRTVLEEAVLQTDQKRQAMEANTSYHVDFQEKKYADFIFNL